MTSPSHAAPDRSPAAGEETAGRSPRKRVTVITATALSLLEACGLGPSPSRPDKTAGKEGRAPQGDAPAGKVPADHPQARQAEEPASSRRRSGGRKTASAPDRAPRTVAGRPPEEEAPLTVAAGSVAVPEDLPVIPSEPATPPGPAAFPKKNAARRRRAGSPAARQFPRPKPEGRPPHRERALRMASLPWMRRLPFRVWNRRGLPAVRAVHPHPADAAARRLPGCPPHLPGKQRRQWRRRRSRPPGVPRMRRHGLPRRTVWRRNTVCRHRAAGWWCCPGMRTGTIFPPQGMTGRLTPGPPPAPS